MGLVFIGGGARSGKSRFALEYAETRYSRRAFLATAQALDDEMRARISRHRAERAAGWTTIEEPYDIANAIEASAGSYDVIVLDCLTLWLSNVMLDSERDTEHEIAKFAKLLELDIATNLVVITNEVGCGIVPDNPLAREYRDRAGELNQTVARVANEAYWMVFGIPLRIKPPMQF